MVGIFNSLGREGQMNSSLWVNIPVAVGGKGLCWKLIGVTYSTEHLKRVLDRVHFSNVKRYFLELNCSEVLSVLQSQRYLLVHQTSFECSSLCKNVCLRFLRPFDSLMLAVRSSG